jgi:hypothetical protein
MFTNRHVRQIAVDIGLFPMAGSTPSPRKRECRIKKWMAWSGLALIAVLVAIQFVPVTAANPPCRE